MPNVKLKKDDDHVLVLPPASIVAVFSVEKQTPPKKNPHAKSIIFSTYRNFSVYFLKMTGREAFDAIADQDDSPREWIEMPVGDDASYIPPKISAVEGIEMADETPGLRVWITRPDGQEGYTDVDYNESLFTLLCERIGADDSDPASRRKTKIIRPAPKQRPMK